MRSVRLGTVVAGVVLLAACGGPTAEPAPASTTRADGPVVVGTLATGLEVPWAIAPLPDGAALVTHRDSGEISRVTPDGAVEVLGTVAGVVPGGEGGLLGIAVAPDDPRAVFVYYTAATDNRITRLTVSGSGLADQEVVLDGIPKGSVHDGGRIAFGPDGLLYAGTGETGRPELAQDPASLGGKILRVRADGSPARDNPDPSSPVYSLGHRNVQGLAWDDAGRLWASEFGQSDVDELNLIEPGGNYGWPECEGTCGRAEFVDPAAEWSPTATASPSGMAIVAGSAWVASLRGEVLYQVPLAGDSAGTPEAWFGEEFGRLREAVAGPDGTLWVATSNTDGRGSPRDGDDRIVVIRPE